VVTKLMEGLNDQGKPLKGSHILVLGIAYKKNVGDTRESPSVEIMELLRQRGADIAYSDPHVPVFPEMRDYAFDLESVPLTAESIGTYDAVVVATHHDDFDYELLRDQATLIIDARGVYRDPAEHIIKA
jgi:UDP-N-acetyl-D-glucosamine dehydrogenase